MFLSKRLRNPTHHHSGHLSERDVNADEAFVYTSTGKWRSRKKWKTPFEPVTFSKYKNELIEKTQPIISTLSAPKKMFRLCESERRKKKKMRKMLVHNRR